MERVLTYEIREEHCGCSIREFLREMGYSRHILTRMKETPEPVQKNGRQALFYERLAAGDVLTVTVPEETPSEHVVPVPLPFSVVYEDEDILVVEKPADMPVHPSVNNHENTLANALADYYQRRGQVFVCRCITRLDRDTTGLLLAAKNMLSASILSDMGKAHKIRRAYLAIAQGQTPPEGTVDAPIARKEGSVLERTVDFAHGARAVTHYRTLAYEDGYSLVLLELETGRTHQIRVHMKYIGHPLIGDFLYNPDFRVMHRQALHSCSLSFTHPITGEAMEFVSRPPWELFSKIASQK